MKHILSLALLLLLAAPCLGQHAAPREQWQPQTENDSRLGQPVAMEIVGRATRTGLPLLSAETGVSLSVAPEDLATVGERKFVLLAQGCTLKTIMVQLCTALQECHWDVDSSGEQPAYLLHRNSGVDYRARPAGTAARERDRQYAREKTLERRADAKAALASPDPALEQTDLPLALALRDPITRSLMEAFLALPQEQLDPLLAEGEVTMAWEEAPPALQQAARQALERSCAWMLRTDSWWRRTTEDMEILRLLKGEPVSLPLTLASQGWLISGVVLHVGGLEFVVIPERRPSANGLRKLLDDTRLNGAVPEAALDEWDDEMMQAGLTERESRREREWVDPHMPVLDLTVETGSADPMLLSALQQEVARLTGLSLVSDSYADDDVYPTREEGENVPVWRLLYQAGGSFSATDWRIYQWRVAGDCLTFWHDDWASLAAQEVPEALLEQYREKLRAQGHLTLDDLAALAAALAPQPERGISLRLPKDLREAGGSAFEPYGLSELALYASLTPEQRAAAEGDGLSFRKMKRGQRAEVQRLNELTFVPPLPAERVQTATLVVQRLPDEPPGISRFDLYFLLDRSAEPHLITHVRLSRSKTAESP